MQFILFLQMKTETKRSFQLMLSFLIMKESTLQFMHNTNQNESESVSNQSRSFCDGLH